MPMSLKSSLLVTLASLALAACTTAQTGPGNDRAPGGGQGPGGGGGGGNGAGRTWDVEQLGASARANRALFNPGTPSVSITVSGDTRTITSNNIPNHNVGRFPNGSVEPQSNTYRVDATPSKNSSATYLSLGTSFGVGTNGVTFDPLAAEFFERGGQDWNYVALNGAIALGLDNQTGHIQPGGEYHYHGIADLMLEAAGATAVQHSPLIGYAADGFPVYALYGFVEGRGFNGVTEMQSGWALKSGDRPGGADAPGGTYDGAFHADYVYVGGPGTLDECNGTTTQTPEHPAGTYAYFLTADYPVVPLCHMGTADPSFNTGPGAR